jgi:hypothetical protein
MPFTQTSPTRIDARMLEMPNPRLGRTCLRRDGSRASPRAIGGEEGTTRLPELLVGRHGFCSRHVRGLASVRRLSGRRANAQCASHRIGGDTRAQARAIQVGRFAEGVLLNLCILVAICLGASVWLQSLSSRKPIALLCCGGRDNKHRVRLGFGGISDLVPCREDRPHERAVTTSSARVWPAEGSRG